MGILAEAARRLPDPRSQLFVTHSAERIITQQVYQILAGYGQQQLSLFHSYHQQHQYFPMMIFEGNTGMPVGAWLRPGTVAASCGAVDMLKSIVDRLKQHWPEVEISVRGDSGLGSPQMYDYCEAESLQ